MNQPIIQLSELTLTQKLNLMESLWEDLSKDNKNIQSPSWHGDILDEREKALKAGKISANDWEEAKERIRKSIK